MKENPVILKTITDLLDSADSSPSEDRMLFISIAGDLSVSLQSGSTAFSVASRFLNIIHSPKLAGKGAALMTVVELIAKFRRHKAFQPLVENAQNEIALCALSAEDKRLRAMAFRVLGMSCEEKVE